MFFLPFIGCSCGSNSGVQRWHTFQNQLCLCWPLFTACCVTRKSKSSRCSIWQGLIEQTQGTYGHIRWLVWLESCWTSWRLLWLTFAASWRNMYWITMLFQQSRFDFYFAPCVAAIYSGVVSKNTLAQNPWPSPTMKRPATYTAATST